MCCPLDQVHGRVVIQSVGLGDNHILHLRGSYDRTPKTLADRIFRIFQRLELVEKISEIADESFHLFGSLLQQIAPSNVYQTLRNLHHAAHEIEHLLHAVCFICDVSRILTGRFLEYQDANRTKLDYLKSAARVCHAAAHFLASLEFLVDHGFLKPNRFEHLSTYMRLCSTAGYAIWTASLIWHRYQGQANDRFGSDLAIHLGGLFFEAIPLAKHATGLESHAAMINKLAAIAGIIHAWHVVDRLMPEEKEAFETHFTVPDPIMDQPSVEEHSPTQEDSPCEGHSPCEEHHHHHYDVIYHSITGAVEK